MIINIFFSEGGNWYVVSDLIKLSKFLYNKNYLMLNSFLTEKIKIL